MAMNDKIVNVAVIVTFGVIAFGEKYRSCFWVCNNGLSLKINIEFARCFILVQVLNVLYLTLNSHFVCQAP